MNIEKIIKRYNELEQELHYALATMEKKDDIPKIRELIKENQSKCPHFSNKYNWEIRDETCPYCGAKI